MGKLYGVLTVLVHDHAVSKTSASPNPTALYVVMSFALFSFIFRFPLPNVNHSFQSAHMLPSTMVKLPISKVPEWRFSMLDISLPHL